MEHNKTIFKTKGAPLIKFQSSERIKSLREGHLYAKTLQYYRDIERETGDDEIGDEFEAMWHVNEGIVRHPNTSEVIKLNDTLIPTANSNDFAFCMFGIYPNLTSFSFTDKQKEKMLSFGDTALLVLDSDELIRRVFTSAKNAGYKPYFGAVQYFNPAEDNGNMIISLLEGMWNIAFWKRDKYTYQQESRFVLANGNGEDHIELDIGDISDITEILSSKAILTAIVEKKL